MHFLFLKPYFNLEVFQFSTHEAMSFFPIGLSLIAASVPLVRHCRKGVSAAPGCVLKEMETIQVERRESEQKKGFTSAQKQTNKKKLMGVNDDWILINGRN